jgi:hypothetical protein
LIVKREDIYRQWTPANDPWSAWVKPVLFGCMDEDVEPRSMAAAPSWLHDDIFEPVASAQSANLRAHAPYRHRLEVRDTVLVVDLPGEIAVRVGVAVIGYGFRPVPLFNVVYWEAAIIDMRPTMRALVDGAAQIAAVRASSPPAFLLHADRMSGRHLIRPGVFDNRSVCSESDFPSADALWNFGIRRALLMEQSSDRPSFDLEPTLFDWQNRGIVLWRKLAGSPSPATPYVLKHRPVWSRLFHHLRRSCLHRAPDGTYGVFITEPSTS